MLQFQILILAVTLTFGRASNLAYTFQPSPATAAYTTYQTPVNPYTAYTNGVIPTTTFAYTIQAPTPTLERSFTYAGPTQRLTAATPLAFPYTLHPSPNVYSEAGQAQYIRLPQPSLTLSRTLTPLTQSSIPLSRSLTALPPSALPLTRSLTALPPSALPLSRSLTPLAQPALSLPRSLTTAAFYSALPLPLQRVPISTTPVISSYNVQHQRKVVLGEPQQDTPDYTEVTGIEKPEQGHDQGHSHGHGQGHSHGQGHHHHHHDHHHHHHETQESYSFGYDINDSETGDSKRHYEKLENGVVQGTYSLVDPDGTVRTVDYTADAVHGFNAVVRKDPVIPPTSAQPVPDIPTEDAISDTPTVVVEEN